MKYQLTRNNSASCHKIMKQIHTSLKKIVSSLSIIITRVCVCMLLLNMYFLIYFLFNFFSWLPQLIHSSVYVSCRKRKMRSTTMFLASSLFLHISIKATAGFSLSSVMSSPKEKETWALQKKPLSDLGKVSY